MASCAYFVLEIRSNKVILFQIAHDIDAIEKSLNDIQDSVLEQVRVLSEASG